MVVILRILLTQFVPLQSSLHEVSLLLITQFLSIELLLGRQKLGLLLASKYRRL